MTYWKTEEDGLRSCAQKTWKIFPIIQSIFLCQSLLSLFIASLQKEKHWTVLQAAATWFRAARWEVSTVSDVIAKLESGLKHVIQVCSLLHFALFYCNCDCCRPVLTGTT